MSILGFRCEIQCRKFGVAEQVVDDGEVRRRDRITPPQRRPVLGGPLLRPTSLAPSGISIASMPCNVRHAVAI